VLWPERLGISIQEAPEWELILSDAPQRAELLGALSSSGKDPHLEAGQQWFAVWAQQRVVGALGVDVSLSAHIVSEAAGVVGDLLHAFLRSQARVFTDALTGIHNRSFFDHQFPVELERSRRANQPLALLFADIDHFKSVNDRFGHDVGDLVLQHVARLIVTHLRRIDYAFRWGGEEFAVILPGTRAEEATISIGMANFPGNSARDAELLRCADQALYQAKEAGRDRVVVWSGAAPPELGAGH
jgi:GGDEF domain-containing protein